MTNKNNDLYEKNEGNLTTIKDVNSEKDLIEIFGIKNPVHPHEFDLNKVLKSIYVFKNQPSFERDIEYYTLAYKDYENFILNSNETLSSEYSRIKEAGFKHYVENYYDDDPRTTWKIAQSKLNDSKLS